MTKLALIDSDGFALHSETLPLCLTPQTPPLQRTGVRKPAAQRRSAAFLMAHGTVSADRISTALVSGSAGLGSGNGAVRGWVGHQGGSFRGLEQGIDQSQWGWN